LNQHIILIESISNTAVGFVISNLAAYFILPYWGFQQSIANSVEVTLIFTFLSVLRNFFIRTLFSNITEKQRMYHA